MFAGKPAPTGGRRLCPCMGIDITHRRASFLSAHGYRYSPQVGVVYVRAWVSIFPTGGRRLCPCLGVDIPHRRASFMSMPGYRYFPTGGRRLCPHMGFDIKHTCRSGLKVRRLRREAALGHAREPATRNKKTVRNISRTVIALAQQTGSAERPAAYAGSGTRQ